MALGRNNLCQKQRNDKNHGSHVINISKIHTLLPSLQSVTIFCYVVLRKPSKIFLRERSFRPLRGKLLKGKLLRGLELCDIRERTTGREIILYCVHLVLNMRFREQLSVECRKFSGIAFVLFGFAF